MGKFVYNELCDHEGCCLSKMMAFMGLSPRGIFLLRRVFGSQYPFRMIITTVTFISIISHSSTYILQVIHKIRVL